MSAIGRGWQRLSSSATLRGISVIASGAVAAQLVIILASPLLTRLYTPDEFGFLAVFSSLLNTLVVVSSLRYGVATPLATSDRSGVAIVLLCLSLLLVFSLCLLGAVALFGEMFAALVNAPENAVWFYLLPLAILLAGAFEIFRGWAIRTRAFSDIAKAKFQQSVAMTLVQLGGFRFGVAALLVGQVVGRFSGSLRLVRPFRLAQRRQSPPLAVSEMLDEAREYRRFPLYSTWGTLLNVSGRQFPAIFFAALADPAIAGLYALAQRILATPLSFVSDAISSVFTSIASRAGTPGKLRHAVESFNMALCLLASVPILALVVFGADAFAIIFGENWRTAGVFAAIMAPWIYLVFVSTPLMVVFSVRARDAELSWFQLALAVLRVAVLFAGWYLGDAVLAVALFSGVSAVAYLAMTMRLHCLAGSTALHTFRPIVGSFCLAAVVLSPMVLQRIGGVGGDVGTIVAIGLALLFALGYYGWIATRLSTMTGRTA